jgi:hypothetical protein
MNPTEFSQEAHKTSTNMDANIITIAIAKNETGFVFKLPTMKRF